MHDDVDRADAFWRQGLELRRVQDDPHELGVAFGRLASIAWRRRDFDGAIAYHKQALPLFERAGDEGSRLNELSGWARGTATAATSRMASACLKKRRRGHESSASSNS